MSLVSTSHSSSAAEYTGRLLRPLIGSPGRGDLTDPADVRLLVREQLLAPILTPEALAAT
jgi:hypothetical protein